MTAIRHVLGLIAEGELVVTADIVTGLGVALEQALNAYAHAAGSRVGRSA